MDNAIASQVHKVLNRLTGAFRKALERAKTRDEVRSDLDVDGAAELLTATQVCMSVFSRARWDKQRIEHFARHALGTLR